MTQHAGEWVEEMWRRTEQLAGNGTAGDWVLRKRALLLLDFHSYYLHKRVFM